MTTRTRRSEHDPDGPELVIGLVGAIGSELTSLSQGIESALDQVGYTHSLIRLSQQFSQVPNLGVPLPPLDATFFHLTWGLMDAGDALRQRYGNDAVAVLAVAAVREERGLIGSGTDVSVPRHAYIIRSIKRPEEVVLLQKVYGSSFILLGAHIAREQRVANLAREIAKTSDSGRHEDEEPDAVRLVNRDENDLTKRFGQNVQTAFPLASAFFNTTDHETLKFQMTRFIEVLFGHPYHTPLIDEHGMFLAHAARLRSSSLGRQVGAAICTSDGEILSIGTNEVPRGGGGFYWPDSNPDKRDHVLGGDSNDSMIRQLVHDTISRLRDSDWLTGDVASASVEAIVSNALKDPDGPLKNSRITSLIEFGRAVHAEMAAISNAARFGISIQGGSMYVTTFPCHECARHIVASGISRVVYIDPYPKSVVKELFPDSISVDHINDDPNRVSFQPYMGIAPIIYPQMYAMKVRKDSEGKTVAWDGRISEPIFADLFDNIKRNESYVMQQFASFNQQDLGI